MTAYRTARRLAKPPVQAAQRRIRSSLRRLLTISRLAAYRAPDALWLQLLGPAADHLSLRAPSRGHRRVEVGSGFAPTPGYLHVDSYAQLPEVTLLRSAENLGLPSSWADEILCVHVVEHLPPPTISSTLRHWYETLADGGRLVVHTPNGQALGRMLVGTANESPHQFWATQSAIYGYWRHPADATGPARLGQKGDHRVLFTFPILEMMLKEVGFREIEDVSGQEECRHALDWDPFVPGFCLEVRACR